MTITEDRGYYRIAFRYHPRLISGIKGIEGRRFNGKTKEWTVPASSIEQLNRFASYAKHFSDVEWLKQGEQLRSDADFVFELPELKPLEVEHGLKIEPYPYQLEGIQRGLELKRFINADEPGLGKTLQSIATINLADAFPCLVICPASLKINWEREWHKFTDKKAMVLTDSVKDSWPFFWQTGLNQVFITNYESLKKYFVQRIKKKERWTLRDVEFRDSINLFKSVIIDESHKVKSSATQQAKFTKGITKGKEWIIQLTGTPVVNKPKDLIAQISILERMQDFGGYKHFVGRYCGGPNEASNLKELNYNLWRHAMFRRQKHEVLKDLPDKTRQTLVCEITNRKEYQDAERDLIQYLRKYKDASDDKIARAMRGEVMVRIGILRQISARGKIKEVVEFVKDFRENKQKIVLFCSLHEVVDALKDAFPSAVCVTGRENQQQKQTAIDSFQNNPDTDIIICSIRAAGVGLTLTSSSNVAFIEFPWTYADCVQCEDRCIVEGEPILTPNGWIPVEDIKVGDLVINRFGQNAVVKDAWSRENVKLVTEVKIMGWGVTKTTNDHKYLTTKGWKEASTLMPGDRVIMPHPESDCAELVRFEFDDDCRIPDSFTGWHDGEIPNGRLIKAPTYVELTDDALFVFGYFIGDGFSSIKEGKGRFISVSGHSVTKRESLDRCKKWFESIGLNYTEYSREDSKGVEIRAYSAEWALFFNKHFGTGSHNKQLPEFLMNLSVRQSDVILDGLMSSDGYYRKQRYEYITISEKLASQVARLILKVGFRPTVSKNTTNCFVVGYSLSQKDTSSMVQSVHTYFPKRKNGRRSRVYDITTDDTKSFVLGMSVVHNCHRIGQKDNVTAHYFLGRDTIDTHIYQIIQEKKSISNAVMGSTEEIPENIVDMIANIFNK